MRSIKNIFFYWKKWEIQVITSMIMLTRSSGRIFNTMLNSGIHIYFFENWWFLHGFSESKMCQKFKNQYEIELSQITKPKYKSGSTSAISTNSFWLILYFYLIHFSIRRKRNGWYFYRFFHLLEPQRGRRIYTPLCIYIYIYI